MKKTIFAFSVVSLMMLVDSTLSAQRQLVRSSSHHTVSFQAAEDPEPPDAPGDPDGPNGPDGGPDGEGEGGPQ